MKSPLGSTIESMMSLIVAVFSKSGAGDFALVHALPIRTNVPNTIPANFIADSKRRRDSTATRTKAAQQSALADRQFGTSLCIHRQRQVLMHKDAPNRRSASADC